MPSEHLPPADVALHFESAGLSAGIDKYAAKQTRRAYRGDISLGKGFEHSLGKHSALSRR